MKQSIKKFANFFFFPLSKKLGYTKLNTGIEKFTKSKADNPMHNFYSMLNDVNFIPGHIVDIGANKGNWTREALEYFPDAQFTLLEPQALMQDLIKDILETNPKVKFYALGAGSSTGNLKFTIAPRHDSCSFMYSEEEAERMGLKQIDVPVVTLNDFLSDKGLPVPGIIKIDAEGLDLDVLAGASNFFGMTEMFLVEGAVMNKFYPNTVLAVSNFMDTRGYRLCDMTSLNRTPVYKALWLVDLIFIKKDGAIDKSISTYN